MTRAMKWMATAVVTMGLLWMGVRSVGAAEPPAAADPATWGVYAHLPGTEWNNGNARWDWGPANTIVESRTFQMKSVIRPGAKPGELVSVYGGGLHTFDGRIAADGSVLWVRRGRFLKMPSRVSLTEGVLIEQMVTVDDSGQIAKLGSVLRFDQTAGPKVAVLAPAPSQSVAAAVEPAPLDARTSNPASEPQKPGAGIAPEQPALQQPVPAAAPARFDALVSMLGKMFLGGNQTIEFPAGASVGSFSLRYANYLDANTVTFTYVASGQPGIYSITRQPADLYYTNLVGTVQADGTLEMTFQPINPNGYTYAYRYQAKGAGLLETRLALKKKWLSSTPETTTQALNDYLPYSPAQYKAQADWLVLERQIMGSPEEQAAQRAREARQAKIESDQALGRAFNNMLGDLSDHAAREAQTRADADAMLAQINAQAQAQHLAQQQAQAREAQAQAQAQQARVQQAQQAQQAQAQAQAQQAQAQAQAPRAPVEQPANAAAGQAAQTPGAKPLRFILNISLRNLPGDKVNPSCYSNTITRPGPPGWGAPGFLPPGSGEQARATVYSFKAAFIAKCRASGRDVTSEGNFNYVLNDSQYAEQQLQAARRHYPEDVSVTLD